GCQLERGQCALGMKRGVEWFGDWRDRVKKYARLLFGFWRRWAKCAGRRPARINVSVVEGIELGPENVAFGAERVVGLLLFLASAGVFHDPGQGVVGVFGGLGHAGGEII